MKTVPTPTTPESVLIEIKVCTTLSGFNSSVQPPLGVAPFKPANFTSIIFTLITPVWVSGPKVAVQTIGKFTSNDYTRPPNGISPGIE